MFRVDTHIHTSEVSPCGKLTARETVEGYRKAGYDAICISDHLNRGILKKYDGGWKEKIERWLLGYREARKAGEEVGLRVFLAAEVKLDEANAECWNEYLLYGLTEQFLLENEELIALPFEKFVSLAHKNNLLVVQAHPFRPHMKTYRPDLLDGVEAYNGNARNESHNEEALAFAYYHHLRPLSGSDCHQLEDMGRGGIILEQQADTIFQLKDIIVAGKYRLLPKGFEDSVKR